MGRVDEYRKDRIGLKFMHPKYGEYKIVTYVNANCVDVKFKDTGSTHRTTYHNSLRGEVMDCMQPTVCGVGIKGSLKTREYGLRVKSYTVWVGMISRCYNEGRHKTHPTYIGCSVCDEWLYYPNFKVWFDDNYIEGYELDKDIKVKGNKIYSPETCMFVSKAENLKQAQAHTYKIYRSLLLNPEGVEVEVSNQRQFCRDTGLHRGCVGRLISGKQKHHKGWKFIRRLDDN